MEAVYHEALLLELVNRNVPYESEVELPIHFKGQTLRKKYIADIVCYNKIIVELKAISELTNDHLSQVFNYLKATGFKIGLLINFAEPTLVYKRIA